MQEGAAGRRLILLYVSVLVLLAAVVKWFYWDLAVNLYYMVQTEEYSYLTAAILVAVVVVGLTAREAEGGEGVGVGRFLLYGLLLSMSATSYLLAERDLEYVIQYRMLSLVLLAMMLYLAVFEPRRPRDVIPVLGLLLLVPPPISWIDYVSNRAGVLVARLTSAITGVPYRVGPVDTVLEVPTPFGVEEFAVTTACTGIISMSSALAVTPLLAYIAASSKGSAARRALAVFLAAGAGVLVAFTGNLLRLVILVEAAKAYGIDFALLVFHYTPSIIYAPLAVIVGLWVARRVLGGLHPVQAPRVAMRIPGLARIAAVSLLLVFFMSGLAIAKAAAPLQGPVEEPIDYALVYNETSSIVFGLANATILHTREMTGLEELLGASKVELVRVEWSGVEYTGYVELVESVSRLHTWQMCLVAQGYRVGDAWTVEEGGARVYVLSYEGGASRRLLAYTLLSLPADFGGRVEEVYVRVSLVVDDEAGLGPAVRLLSSLAPERVEAPGEGFDLLPVLVYVDYVLFILLVAYILALSADRRRLASLAVGYKKLLSRRYSAITLRGARKALRRGRGRGM